MWWHLILHFQVLHFLVLHFQRPPFNAAVRSISLACPADYCFIVTHWHNIWSFLANKRERERGGEIAHTTQWCAFWRLRWHCPHLYRRPNLQKYTRGVNRNFQVEPVATIHARKD